MIYRVTSPQSWEPRGKRESDYFHHCTKKPTERILLPIFVTLASTCSEVLMVKGEMHPPGHSHGSTKLDCPLTTLGSFYHWTNRQRKRSLYWLEWLIPIKKQELRFCYPIGQELHVESRTFIGMPLSFHLTNSLTQWKTATTQRQNKQGYRSCRNEGLGQTKRNAGKRKGDNGMGEGIRKPCISTLALTPTEESRSCSN